ncbi:MAG: hypothetical protein ACAI35_20060 [Candidatus Methylacidiphilales bacterium]
MMNKTFCCMIASLFLSAPCIWSQPVETPLPPLPRPESVFASVPGAVVWTVTYTYPEEMGTDSTPGQKPSLKGRIRSLKTSRLGDVTHILMVNIDSANQDIWSTGDEHYGKCNHTSDWGKASLSSIEALRGFPGTDWMAADQQVGKVVWHDTECVLFMPKPHPTLEMGDAKKLKAALEKAPFFAIMDAKTRLPIEIHSGGIKEVFEFGPAPRTLELPDDLTAQINQGKRVRALMNARAPRPY